jgi:ferrous iron transport protein B
MLGCLNIWDERKHHGIEIDVGGLEKETGIIFVPTVGITGEGIKDLIDSFGKAKKGSLRTAEEGRWKEIGKIIQKVQTINYRRHTFLERLEELSVQPWSGIPIALMILGAVFWIIRTIGEGIIAYIAEPLFEILWTPVVLRLSSVMGGSGFIHDIIIGKLVNGGVDYGESLGLLTTGLFVPLASVLPYVFGFYLVVSFLEDFGYLPRLSVLVDNLMHKLGVHGYSVIPFMLGFGCNVPGMLATRVMENKRERFIVATLTAVAIPCMAQIAMVFGLLGDHGNWPFFAVFFVLFLVWFTLGVIMNRLVKGQTPELFVEIPPYRIPYFKALVKKVLMRVRWFIKEAVPWPVCLL